MKRMFLILVLIALVGAGSYFFFDTTGEEPSKRGGRSQVIGVERAAVERRDLVRRHVYSGTLEAEYQYDAAPKIGGRISQIAVRLGDCVSRGALIARLDSEEFELQLAQAQAELDVALASLAEARSSLEMAERDYQRELQLREQKVSSRADLEEAETERLQRQAGVRLAEAQIEQRRAALRSAEVRLSYTELSADWQAGAGAPCRYVASRYVNEGETISANVPVVTLVDLSQLKAVINVAEKDYAQLQVGQIARISVDSLTNHEFTGKIVRMAPVFEETSRQARIEIAVANPDSILKSGMFARVHIELERVEGSIAVPRTAVIRREGRTGVFVVADGIAEFREIRTGIEDGDWVAADNLSEGQWVVTLGHHLLSDGVRVAAGDDQGPGSESKRGRRE